VTVPTSSETPASSSSMAPGAEPTLDPDDFLTFTDICRWLPNVRPRATLAWLRDAWGEALLAQESEVTLGVKTVAVDELGELFYETFRTGYETRVVSPRGARLLLRLYAAGVLDTGKKKPGAPAPELVAYAESEGALHEKSAARQEQRRQAEAERQEFLAHPEKVPESALTFGLLNDLFFHHGCKGNSEMSVGGLLVEKSVSRYTSNSGKSQDWRVTFTWRSSGGGLRELTKHSAFEDNRRNDPDRNWGLPE